MSQGDLAAHMDALGIPWKRPTVVNLEKRAASSGSRTGGPGRDSLTLQELMGLALVLEVPPVSLLVDLPSGSPFPLTPDLEPVDAWSGLRWLVGDRALPDDPAGGGVGAWHDESRRMRWGLRAMQLTTAFERDAERIIAEAAEPPAPEAAAGTPDAGRQRYHAMKLSDDIRLARELRVALTKARDLGLQLPDLPETVVEAMHALGVSLTDDESAFSSIWPDGDEV